MTTRNRKAKVPATPANEIESALRRSLKPDNHGQTAARSRAVVARLARAELLENIDADTAGWLAAQSDED